ncbi:MAG: c-type cytochrome [Gemmatimonadota bacterium]
MKCAPMPKFLLAGLALALMAGCSTKADRPAPADSVPSPTPQATADTTTPPPTVSPPSTAPVTATTRPSPKPPAVPTTKPATRPTPAPTTAPAPAPVASTAPTPDPYHPAPRDTLDVDAYQGWKQFELNCSRCHGEYAVGTSFAPALVVSLKEGGTIPTKEMFITTVCAGRLDKGMPSWCALGLEMNKIDQIYQYVKGRADGKIAAGRPAQRQ